MKINAGATLRLRTSIEARLLNSTSKQLARLVLLSRSTQGRGLTSLFHISTPGSLSIMDATAAAMSCQGFASCRRRASFNWPSAHRTPTDRPIPASGTRPARFHRFPMSLPVPMQYPFSQRDGKAKDLFVGGRLESSFQASLCSQSAVYSACFSSACA